MSVRRIVCRAAATSLVLAVSTIPAVAADTPLPANPPASAPVSPTEPKTGSGSTEPGKADEVPLAGEKPVPASPAAPTPSTPATADSGAASSSKADAASEQQTAEKKEEPAGSPSGAPGSTATAPSPSDRPVPPASPAPSKPQSEPVLSKDTPAAKGADKPPAAQIDLVEQAIIETSRRKLTAGVHTPWQIVHGILAMRWELMLQRGAGVDDVNAIEWITSGVYHDGQPLWEATPFGGRGHPFTRPYAFEGHPTQFMGYMTMANIPLEYEVKTPSKVVTIRDIVNDAKMQVKEGVEITWTLWTLAHYEEPDAQWFNAAGEPWSIERLMKLQVDEPVTSGACGGCHGLFALAYARNMYLSTGKPLRGVWFEADQKIKRYIEEARALQNPDGSFSSNHFKGPGFSSDFPTRIATSGHQLEWLMIALPQRKLKEEWLQRAITCVANDLINNRHVASDCGPLFHGVHALVVYRQRTVPDYLVPRFNSHVKLSERGKKPDQATEASKTTSRGAPGQPKSTTAPQSGAPQPAASRTAPKAGSTVPAAATFLDAPAARK